MVGNVTTMVWHGMVWHGMAWHGMVWYGMDQHALIPAGWPVIYIMIGVRTSSSAANTIVEDDHVVAAPLGGGVGAFQPPLTGFTSTPMGSVLAIAP